MSPQRIQLRRTKGFNLQAASRALNGLPAVKCARPGIFGNPFKGARAVPLFRLFMRKKWTELERQLIAICPGSGPGNAVFVIMGLQMRRHEVEKRIAELRGKNLACFCAAGKACHCDVLLELANKPERAS